MAYYKKALSIFITMLLLTTIMLGQQKDLGSGEIIRVINLIEVSKKRTDIPLNILQFLSVENGKKFKLKKLGSKRNFTDLDTPGRYFLYSSCTSNFLLLSYISVGYTTNTHILIFNLADKKILNYANIIVPDHFCLSDLKKIVVEKKFKTIHSVIL